MLMVRAEAMLRGRLAPSVADVAAVARPVLIHRMALSFGARARGEDLAALIAETCDSVTGAEAAA
jgi:MoxR-like ATPase